MSHSLRCEICGAFLVLGASTVKECYENEWFKLHKEWHDSINASINAAAQVGAHADLMTKPIG